MRLLEALGESNPTGNSSAINRSATPTFRVLSRPSAPDLNVYEVDDSNPTSSSVGDPLFSGASTDEIDIFLASHGYNFDPEEWYPC
jgi:hypothetical protein